MVKLLKVKNIMKIRKQYLIIAGVVIIILLVVIYWFFGRKNVSNNQALIISPTEAVIPTIDSSVIVDLTSTTAGKEVLLSINKIPSGTNTIDYELSYQTAQQGLQGVIGTITITNDSSYKKTITLGTCSSGKCVYHQVVGKIKLTLKFTGEYGDKIFEKEYGI